MTKLGIIHLLSLLYLSGVFCLAISINENRLIRRIILEALRRWAKLLGVGLLIGMIVFLLG